MIAPNTLKFPAILLALAALAALGACAKKEAPKAGQPVPVLAAYAASKDVPVELHAIGNVEAYSTVTVKSLVPGQIIRVHFREGDYVSKGQILFSIDPRSIEASLRQAEATQAKDTVDLKNAEVESARYKELVDKGIVSREQYDQFRTTAESLREAVKADKAAVEVFRVSLSYTSIYSPVEGRTGNLSTKEGNVVKDNDTTMVVINQVRPIYVTFSVPEQSLPDIRKYMARGRLKVRAFVHGDKEPVEGVLTFIDNAVDAATGMIKLKGTFENAENKLWPGQYVDTALTLTTQAGATVVPSAAVQTGQQGQFVFVIKPDMTVEQRPVSSSLTYGDDTVVDKGVKPGERVVTDGQLRLVPGTKVGIKPGL